MAQSTDNTLSNQSGASFRTELNSILGAHLSSHKGGSEPSYITTGGLWIDDASTPWIYNVYDGAASFGFLEINPSTNNVTLINVKDGDARTEGASIGQIQDSAFHVLGSVSGTNTITASLTPAITAYAAGQSFNFVVAVTNTGAVTININSVGAKAIQKNGAALVAGDLTAGDLAHIIYDGTQFQLVSPARTPVLTAGSIATAALANEAVTIAKIGSGAATDGQVLTADGSGGAAFEDAAGGGGWVPLSTQTVSVAVASVDFTSGIDGTYDVYVIVLSDVRPVTDNQQLYARSGNGGSFDSGSGNYADVRLRISADTTLGQNQNPSDTKIILTDDGVGNGTPEGLGGIFKIFSPSDPAMFTRFDWDLTFLDDTRNLEKTVGIGSRQEVAAHDRVQFYFASGNIASGTFTLYGLAGA